MRLAFKEQEIFFVATPNSDKQYSFELDVADSAKDFGQLSGMYSLVREFRTQFKRGVGVCDCYFSCRACSLVILLWKIRSHGMW